MDIRALDSKAHSVNRLKTNLIEKALNVNIACQITRGAGKMAGPLQNVS